MSPTHHPPGSFCWAELITSDGPAAKSFYSQLMGWETHDDPLPGGGLYTMLRLAGGNVGAMYELTAEMRAQGVPPNWLPYVTVEDAYATAARVKGLGGSVAKEAFDVFDVGAMAVLEDPTGGTFAVWQPKKHTGTDHTDGKPGSVCWNELASRDAEAARSFYAELFGWQPEIRDMEGHGQYTVFKQGDAEAAGLLQMAEEWGEAPSHWTVYFSVTDCNASAEKATRLGGTVCVPPTDISSVGRMAVLNDPQGAVFSIIQLGGAE